MCPGRQDMFPSPVMSFILGKTEAASSRDLMESTDLRPMRLLTGSAEGRFASLLNRTVSDCILT